MQSFDKRKDNDSKTVPAERGRLATQSKYFSSGTKDEYIDHTIDIPPGAQAATDAKGLINALSTDSFAAHETRCLIGLRWLIALLACVPDVLDTVYGAQRLSKLFEVMPLSEDDAKLFSYVLAPLSFSSNGISNGDVIKENIRALYKLKKGEIPKDWVTLEDHQQKKAKLISGVMVGFSSLYDGLSSIYFTEYLEWPLWSGILLAFGSWFANISGEGFESYKFIRECMSKESKTQPCCEKWLSLTAGNFLSLVGAFEDTLESAVPLIILSKAPYGSPLHIAILVLSIFKFLTSNFYVGQWTRDAIRDGVSKFRQGMESHEKISFFAALVYSLFLAEAKRGGTTSFLQTTELPFTLSDEVIEAIGVFVSTREAINNIWFVYPYIKKLMELCFKEEDPTAYKTLTDKPYTNGATQTLFQKSSPSEASATGLKKKNNPAMTRSTTL